MKKILPLLLIAFLICLAASYFIFSELLPEGLLQDLQAATATAFNRQRSVALIYVNELESPKPSLISVWVFFLNDSDHQIIKVLPLLPSADFDQTTDLASKFENNSDGTLSPEFLNVINETYQLSLKDYVVLDAQGVSLISKWTLKKKSLLPVEPAATSQEAAKILSSTRKYLQSICSYIPEMDDQASPTDYLGELIPEHLRSNLRLDDFISTLSRIRSQYATVECETIN